MLTAGEGDGDLFGEPRLVTPSVNNASPVGPPVGPIRGMGRVSPSGGAAAAAGLMARVSINGGPAARVSVNGGPAPRVSMNGGPGGLLGRNSPALNAELSIEDSEVSPVGGEG